MKFVLFQVWLRDVSDASNGFLQPDWLFHNANKQENHLIGDNGHTVTRSVKDHKYDYQFRAGPNEDESSPEDAKEGGATNWAHRNTSFGQDHHHLSRHPHRTDQ